VRYSRLTGQPSLPPDLEPLASLALESSAILQRTVSPDPTAVLDIHRYMPLSKGYDADELADLFDKRLHQDIQLAFKALTTDHARAMWSGAPPA